MLYYPMELLEDIGEQVRIRMEKLEQLQKEGRDPFLQTLFTQTNNSGQILNGFDKLDGKTVSIAGRIVLQRVMGKASFCHILDEHGKIQFYISTNDVGEQAYEDFKKYDLGDIVGVTGKVFKTKTGEISIHATTIVLLAKALHPLPDKHAGLKDAELRYRERHVDLIVNEEVREIFKKRSKVIKAVRDFLDNNGFLEVETPVLQNLAGGANARPFVTHHNALDMKMYLRIAVELHHKRLIIGGFEKIYEVGRVFRNEGISYKHNPEFTMLEYYCAYTDYHGISDYFEKMIKHVIKTVAGKDKISYQGVELDFSKPIRRVKMIDIVKEVTGLDFAKLDAGAAEAELKKLKLDLPKLKTWGTLLYAAFDQCVEKTLVQPTFVMEYPVEVAIFCKQCKHDSRLAELAELFICGKEMGNSYTEINNPIDQRSRFAAQVEARAGGDDEAHEMDEDFLKAMSYGMPPTGGQGCGIDRLVMLLTDTHSIRESLLFPTMRNKV